MNLDSTLATIGSYVPELEQAVQQAAAYIPDDLSRVIRHASSYLPSQFDFWSIAQFMLYFAVASLVMGVLGRVVLGKRSSLNHSLSSVMGILFLYAASIVIYTFKPWQLELLLSPLPFVSFAGDYLIVLPMTDTQFPALCSEILSLVILAFLVNMIDSFIPKGENFISWLFLRLISVLLSLALHILVSWAFNAYLPEVLVTYAPMILLFLLVFLLLSGLLNLILGLVIAVTNPFMGAMYTFFFSNVIGKQLSKAVFSTAILCLIIFLLDYFGYIVITITAAALLTYIPLALVLLLLWFVIGHLL